MALEFNFIADCIVKDKAYPALARHKAQPYTPQWREFVQHWPHTVPCELHEHCRIHQFPYKIRNTQSPYSFTDFYTIGLGFFDFTIDYFDLLSKDLLRELRQLNLRVLFYYHEGDNPYRIEQRLNTLCHQHCLSTDCYVFVSGNTAADNIRNFVYFSDHELLYQQRNSQIAATPIHTRQRPYEFTVLSRTHKWWRATVMTDLQRTGILDRSQWSYNTNVSIHDQFEDNPIEIDLLDIRTDMDKFLQNGPYSCDTQTPEQHNDHHLHLPYHYTDSYCNIVLETHFDADQSSGAFLTEKIFKPIKHGQPFVVVGAPGSLQALRKLGYRTFDHAIDNSYDNELNNTRRWQLLQSTIKQIQSQNMQEWFIRCWADVSHNQQLFLSSKYNRLNSLLTQITHI
jgi:hypothetical protein